MISDNFKMPIKKITNSLKETEQFAKEFAKNVKPFCFIALIGELGAGKTAFVRGLTFSIINEYIYGSNKKIVHCDLYRIKGEEDLYCTGFFDLLYDENVIILAEWAQNILNFLPTNHIKVNFKVLTEEKREITIC